MALEPCFTAHLFRPLAGELIALLRSLDAAEWGRRTVAPKWTVRDVAAHMLDGELRKIAVYRDGHRLPLESPITSDRRLTDFINSLNASGVSYATRLSSRLLVDLLEITAGWAADLYEALPPHGESIFAVSWAGERRSENWMDIGREYTERWHHQMQIRDAAARPLTLLQPKWMTPLLDISVRALPYSYRNVAAPAGATVTLMVGGETPAAWTLTRGDGAWQISAGGSGQHSAVVRVSADTLWRVLYNAPFDPGQVHIEGDAALAAPLLNTRSVIV